MAHALIRSRGLDSREQFCITFPSLRFRFDKSKAETIISVISSASIGPERKREREVTIPMRCGLALSLSRTRDILAPRRRRYRCYRDTSTPIYILLRINILRVCRELDRIPLFRNFTSSLRFLIFVYQKFKLRSIPFIHKETIRRRTYYKETRTCRKRRRRILRTKNPVFVRLYNFVERNVIGDVIRKNSCNEISRPSRNSDNPFVGGDIVPLVDGRKS